MNRRRSGAGFPWPASARRALVSWAAALVFAAPAAGQAYRLHTSSTGSSASTPFVVSFDPTGQPLPLSQGTLPSGFVATWQFPASPQPYSLRLSPSIRFAWSGAAADEAVEISGEARTVLQNGGFLDGSGNWTGGTPRSAVLSATAVREGRYLLALDSSSKGALAVVEIGVENGRPTIRSAQVRAGASLPVETYGVLGAGITIAPDLSRGTVVFGDASFTYSFLYSPGATGNRFSAIDAIPNPSGFQYVGATSAGQDGAFWVVGLSGASYQVRYLDAKTRAWDAPVASLPRAAGDVLIPAFDPTDAGRMLLVVSKVGSTPAWVVTGLARGVVKGVLSPSASNSTFDFSSAPSLPPIVLVPVGPGGRAFLLGRTGGESSERLYAFDLATGSLGNTPIVFGPARHQALVLEKPDVTQSLSLRADGSGAVAGGQTATFTVTRTDVTGSFTATYTTRSADGSAVAGRDYDAGSGSVTLPAGSATGTIAIPVRAVDGCAPQRTFSVLLTNTNATLSTAEAQRPIAASGACSFGVVAPASPVAAGQPLVFTVTRSGSYLAGALALAWTAAPGNSSTTAADFTPSASTVTLPSDAASATLRVETAPATGDCMPEKAVKVSLSGGASATGRIAAVTTGCTVLSTLTAPATPYLPGDEVDVVLSEVQAGRFNLDGTAWTLTSLGGTTWEKVLPAGQTGRKLTLRYSSASAPEAAGSVKVDYRVPGLGGVAEATGSLTLERVASYADLVRLDGPGQYTTSSGARRHSLIWGGSTRAGTWLERRAGTRKTLRWFYERNGLKNVVTCERRSGEDCAFAIPAADATKVAAEVSTSTGDLSWAPVAEIPVRNVAAPTTTGIETVRYVPVALEYAGVAPTFFETELTLVNGTPVTVEAELTWNGVSQKYAVGAGRQLVLNGLAEALRETSPGLAGTAGPAKVVFRGLGSDADRRLVGVVARTTTPAGGSTPWRRSGRAGLAYQGLRRDQLLGGESGQARAAWLIGLRGTSSQTSGSVDRTNLAVVRPDPADPAAVVDVELYGNDGVLLKTLSSQAVAGFTQWSNLAGSQTGGTEVAFARVAWKSGGPVTTYATPVNNVSGDGSWVFPVKQEDAGAEKTDALVAPVLFELPEGGAGLFRFVADAVLTSTAGATSAVLDYSWTGAGQSGATSLPRTVQGQSILGSTQAPGSRPQGVVDELRKGTGSTIPAQAQGQLVIGTGLIRRQDGQAFVPGTLMAGARVDGPTAGDPDASKYGRFGIYLPAIPLRDLLGTRLAELRIQGLRQDSWVRSNLALINPGAEAVTLKLQLAVTKADGSAATVLPTASCGSAQVASGVVTLPAKTFCQIGSVLSAAGATSGYAVVTRTGADAASTTKPFYAYGVVNDGPDSTRGTSDGAYLLAEIASAADLGGGTGGGGGGGGSNVPPTAWSLNASPSSPSVGQAVTFTCTAIAGSAPIVSYDWVLDTGVTRTTSSGSTSYTYATAGTRAYSCSANDSAGMSSNTLTGTVSVSSGGSGGGPGGSCGFVINNEQGVRISFDSSTQTYDAASGQPLTFVASGVTSTVSWNFGNGAMASGNPVTYTYNVAQASSYTVSMSSVGCSASYGIYIAAPSALGFTVTDAATGTVLASSGGIPQAVSGQMLRFTASGASGPVAWNFGDGSTSTEASPYKTYAPVVDATYTVTLVSGSQSKQAIIAVRGSTGAPLTGAYTYRYADGTAVNRSAVQPNEAITFTAADQATTYSWDFGDGSALKSGSPVVYTFTRGGTFTVKLTVSRNGVPGTVTTPSPLAFTVLPPPDPLLWVAAGMVYADGANGALWQSDLSIHNPGTQHATVSLGFVSGDSWSGAGNVTWVPQAVVAGETKSYTNVLESFFRLNKGSWGAVLVRGDSVPVSPVVVTRTYNSAGAATTGTLGLSVPVVSVAAGVRPGSAAGGNFLAGLRHDEAFRTNLTVANLKDETAVVEVLFRDASGTLLGVPAKVTVESRGVKQLNAALSAAPATGDSPIGGAGYANPVSHFSAEVKLLRGSGVYPYATVIDQGSGDSWVVAPPRRPSPTSRLPGIVRVAGASGAFWKSDVVILNPSAKERKARITLSYVRSGSSVRFDASQSVSLQPYEMKVGIDFVRTWLGLSEDDPNGYASSYVDVSPAADDPAPTEPIAVNGRTYYPSGGGSVGLQIDAFGPEDGIREQGTNRKLVLTGLEANASSRTNVALLLVPGSAGSAQVDVHVLDAFGRVARKFSLVGLDAGTPLVQFNSSDLFAGLSTTGDSRATIVIDTPRGTASVGAYATIIDSLSGDATLVGGEPAP